MPKGNPNPRITEGFIARQYKRQDASDVPIARRPVQVRLPVSIDDVVRGLPNMSVWLRKVITEAAQRELMSDSPDAGMVEDRSEKIAASGDEQDQNAREASQDNAE